MLLPTYRHLFLLLKRIHGNLKALFARPRSDSIKWELSAVSRGRIPTGHHSHEMWFILRPAVSRPVPFGMRHLFRAHEHMLSLSFLWRQSLCSKAPSLTRGRIYNLQCNRCLVVEDPRLMARNMVHNRIRK
jgi:hypothetical protein